MNNADKTMDKIVALCKGRGYVYPGSEIYGGLANTWDYGPLGVEFKNNVKKAWWKKFIQESKYNVGLDCAILMNPETWVASGHVGGFSDPLMDCKECKSRHRADKLIEDFAHEKGEDITVDGWSKEKMVEYITENNIVCPKCGKQNFTDIREFNLMFKTFQGVTEDSSSVVYLRPETAQGIFVNFKNVQRTSRKKVPFGIGQIGKSFRNEITPGNFTFRTREFEQMELEFFCAPGTDLEWHAYWKEYCMNFLLNLGIRKENLRFRDHSPEELAFYSNATADIEFVFPFGWGELWGIADRTDYDLKQHMEHSGESLNIKNKQKNFSVPFDKICYIESIKSTHKLILYYDNGMITFYALLKDIEKELDSRFIRCHKSIIVNKNKIVNIDKKKHTIELSHNYHCIYSPRCKEIIK